MLRLADVTVEAPSANGNAFRILRGVSADFDRGTLSMIRGPSGSGKSTLLAVAGLLIRPTHGSVYLDGRAVEGLSSQHRRILRLSTIGFMFQEHRLISRLTAIENILLALSLRGTFLRELACDALEQVGMGNLSDVPVNRLSGGERQRVSIARTLAMGPRVLLCDEPTASLDGESAISIAELLYKLAKTKDCAVVVVTHDQRLESYADAVRNLVNGAFLPGTDWVPN